MMKTSFELLFLAFTFLWQTSATSPSQASPITWQESGRSAVVKLDTPGYPLWIMDKANAPVLHENAGDFYWATEQPSALLFNITLSHDNKTLWINHQQVVPVPNPNVPPRIQAYQVPANLTTSQLQAILSYGVLDREWEGMTLGWRYLDLDYERYITCDPQNSMWAYNNIFPILSFRVMGIGAHARSDILDPWKQPVIRVRLHDTNPEGAVATSPLLSYLIDSIKLETLNSTYYFNPEEVARKQALDTCSWHSWRCRDPLMIESSEPYYRFIWRSRFDSYGRIGSLRHALVEKKNALARVFGDAGPAMCYSFGILFSLAMVVLAVVKAVKYYGNRRVQYIRLLAEDDSILGQRAIDEESEYGEKPYTEKKEGETPPPLPQRPAPETANQELLIDVRVSKGDDEDSSK
jgi:hypothetical protein